VTQRGLIKCPMTDLWNAQRYKHAGGEIKPNGSREISETRIVGTFDTFLDIALVSCSNIMELEGRSY